MIIQQKKKFHLANLFARSIARMDIHLFLKSFNRFKIAGAITIYIDLQDFYTALQNGGGAFLIVDEATIQSEWSSFAYSKSWTLQHIKREAAGCVVLRSHWRK